MEPVDFFACRQCVCTLARRKARELSRAYEKAMRGSGIRASQFTLLATLVQTGPLPATRLADFLGVERTTLTRNLKPLLRERFVRIEDDADRRVHKVAITPTGGRGRAPRPSRSGKRRRTLALAAGGA